MADEAKFGISLEDRMSGPAKQASRSIADLSSELAKTQSTLPGLESKLSANTGALAAQTEQSTAAGLSMKDLAGAGGIFVEVSLAIVAATVAVAAGIGMVIGKLMGMAIAATQGKQAMIGMFGALAGGEKAGVEIEGMLSDLSEQIGITKDELAPLTKSFLSMGITGADALRKVTLAAASAQAIMGDPAAAHAFENLTRKIQVAVQTGEGLKIPAKGLGSLAEAGLTVDDVAKRMNVSAHTLAEQLKNGTVNAKAFGDAMQEALIDKGAGPLQRMGNSFANLRKMAEQYIGDLFEDLGDSIDPFMAQVKDLFSIFSQSSESGKAMKAGIGGAMTFIFQQATKVVPYIKHFFLDLVIWSLQAYIFLKKHWSTIASVLKGVGIMLGLAVGSFVLFVGIIAAAAGVVLALVGGIGLVIAKLVEFGASAIQAGADFIGGLIQGILSAPGRLIDAVTSVADTAKNAFKSALGISSPSKVMMQLGAHATEGVVEGISGGAGDVGQAAAGVGQAAVSGAGGGMKGGGGGGGIQVGEVTIQITAPNGVTHALELTEAAVMALFERVMLMQGA